MPPNFQAAIFFCNEKFSAYYMHLTISIQERKKKNMKEHEFWKERRHLEEMPFDKRFDVNGNSELCHATGYEVFDGEDWWDEFVDSNGDFQYGR